MYVLQGQGIGQRQVSLDAVIIHCNVDGSMDVTLTANGERMFRVPLSHIRTPIIKWKSSSLLSRSRTNIPGAVTVRRRRALMQLKPFVDPNLPK